LLVDYIGGVAGLSRTAAASFFRLLHLRQRLKQYSSRSGMM